MSADAYCRCGHPLAWFVNGWRHVAHERFSGCECKVAAPAEVASKVILKIIHTGEPCSLGASHEGPCPNPNVKVSA